MFGPDKYFIHADVNGHFAYSSLICYPELLGVPVRQSVAPGGFNNRGFLGIFGTWGCGHRLD